MASFMNEDHLLPFQRLDIYVAAKELAKRTHEAKIRDSELRDQATRAAKGTFLGVCEGLPSDAGGVRRRHFDIANNSLHELVGAVDLAEAIAAVDAGVAAELLALACASSECSGGCLASRSGRARPGGRGSPRVLTCRGGDVVVVVVEVEVEVEVCLVVVVVVVGCWVGRPLIALEA